jgi:hypothetical protein
MGLGKYRGRNAVGEIIDSGSFANNSARLDTSAVNRTGRSTGPVQDLAN